MSGASSRKRGHDWERLLANELSAEFDVHIITGRSMGLHYGGDLITVTGYDARERPVTYEPSVLGYAIEAKAVKRRDPAGWLSQADEQKAPGTVPVVLWKRPNKQWHEGSAFLIDDTQPRGWREMPISEWVGRARRWGNGIGAQEACDRIMADRLAGGT